MSQIVLGNIEDDFSNLIEAAQRKVTCEFCNLEYNGNYIKAHKTFFSNTGRFKCDICNKYYLHSYRLIEHVGKHHNGERPSYLCSVCGKQFLLTDAKGILIYDVRQTDAKGSLILYYI